jgi:hypothetical protein
MLGREQVMRHKGHDIEYAKRNRREYLRTLAKMTPSERVMKTFELSALAKQALREAVRRRFPEKSEAELHRIYLARLERCHNNNY